MFKVPNRYRVVVGILASDKSIGNRGRFIIPNPFTRNGKPRLNIVASDGAGWDHVSVSTEFRCPTWAEMCHVKNVFWDEDDVVMQLHPAKESYVNVHCYCLHLWRPQNEIIPLPNLELV